jgi:hypothetical protein
MNKSVFPPFSYLLSGEPQSFIPIELSATELRLPCGRFFYYSPSLEVALSKNKENGSYVLIAGLAIDLLNVTLELKVIAEKLLEELNVSENKFFNLLDYIAGRWLVVYKNPKASSVEIVGDPTSMIKINYSESKDICSSNIFLINRVLWGGRTQYRKEFVERKKLWKSGTIGNFSPIQGVKILTPNHTLNLNTRQMTRFYPRHGEIKELPVANVESELLRLCEIQNTLLKKKFNIFTSLTAGLDSRSSLALMLLNGKPPTFFTYMLDDTHYIDAIVADKIATRLHLNHYCLVDESEHYLSHYEKMKSRILKVKDDAEFVKNIREWCWYVHGPKGVNVCRAMLHHATTVSADSINPFRWLMAKLKIDSDFSSQLPPLHIRSNLFEIGRCFWGRWYGRCNKAENILKQSRKDWAQECPDYFADFFSETELNEHSIEGVDLLDLFYWEHRCGTWVSEVLQETDFVYNTHSYVNCRKILSLLLSVSYENRINGTVFTNIIEKLLPNLTDIPINPKTLVEIDDK